MLRTPRSVELAPSFIADIEDRLEVVILCRVHGAPEDVTIFSSVGRILVECLEQCAQPRKVPRDARIVVIAIGKRGRGTSEGLKGNPQ